MTYPDNYLFNKEVEPSLFELDWPVYTHYKFMLIEDYVKQLPEETQGIFEWGAGNFFKTVPLYNDIPVLKDSLIVIIPDGPIKYSYNPSKMGIKLFESFAYLGTDMNKIQSWLEEYGLPFSTTSYTAKPAKTEFHGGGFHFDNLIGEYITWEGMIENDIKQYVMLKETLLKLIEAARKLLEDLYSIRGIKEKRGKKREKYVKELSKKDRDSLSEDFYRRLNGFLYGASPTLSLASKKNPGDYVRSWQVSNLWTAMIVLFYESVIKNNPVRRCLACNKVINATNGHLKFCPDSFYEKGRKKYNHSSCENRYQQRKRRELLKIKREEAPKNKNEKIDAAIIKEGEAARNKAKEAQNTTV